MKALPDSGEIVRKLLSAEMLKHRDHRRRRNPFQNPFHVSIKYVLLIKTALGLESVVGIEKENLVGPAFNT